LGARGSGFRVQDGCVIGRVIGGNRVVCAPAGAATPSAFPSSARLGGCAALLIQPTLTARCR
ncbi:MAG: hypothetical protein AADX96_13075, partial [Thiocapsa sp. C3-sup]|uniref:hypothetical protein n=1 Tax=Thiocapsa sp. C3-sup TaxID=3137396 RepID=UPI0035B4D25A